MTEPLDYPLLFSAESGGGERENLTGGPSRMRKPSREQQTVRIGPRIDELTGLMRREAARIVDSPSGVEPELILVFEIAQTVDNFYSAVGRIEGLEFLLDFEEELDGQGEFALLDRENNAIPDPVPGSALLVATNLEALQQVLRLWELYQDPQRPRFPHGAGPWRSLFDLLIDVRPWSPRDRMATTGIVEDFRIRLETGATARAEVELWYRSEQTQRQAAENAVRTAVAASNGAILHSAEIADIAYHAVLVELPLEAVATIAQADFNAVDIARSGHVAFIRPEAQSNIEVENLDNLPTGEMPVDEVEAIEAEPLVAVLDGVPLPTHVRLDGRIQLDDPEDFEASAPVNHRQHGTAIAGSVLHGDLSSPTLGPQSIYFRPVLIPGTDKRGRVVESFPADRLALDLLHVAVRRIVEGDGAEPPQAPRVRVINLSLGDTSMQLGLSVSPLARLLDWLGYKYRLLFIVSAGNHERPIEIGIPLADWRDLSIDEARHLSLSRLAADAMNRRIYSPSESVNCLTIGATHEDGAGSIPLGSRLDILPGAGRGVDAAPSPLTAAGGGLLRSIKPDLVAPGGRLVFRPRPIPAAANAVMEPMHSPQVGPGVRVAAASVGSLERESFAVGTSIAAALVSHHAGRVAEALSTMTDPVPDEYLAVCIKALLVHSTTLGRAADEIAESWPQPQPKVPRHASLRLLGYGAIRPSILLQGAESRATILAYGEVTPGTSKKFSFPIPAGLGGIVCHRRIVITLASLLPTDPRHRLHRSARTYFVPRPTDHSLSRVGAHHQSVLRGSVQHEVLEGDRAMPYQDGSTYELSVSCWQVPASRSEVRPVPFALAFTIEVPSGRVPVYSEVAARVRNQAAARLRTRTS